MSQIHKYPDRKLTSDHCHCVTKMLHGPDTLVPLEVKRNDPSVLG
jgi:hypothetical protein